MTDVAVTERLATGLARYAIRQWREQVQAVARHVEAVRGRTPTTGKGVRKLVREMRRAYAPRSFQTCVLESKKGCAVACVVPGIEILDGVEHLSIEQADWIFQIDERRRGNERLLAVHPHALARLFLRLQTVEFARVREELESTLISWRVLRLAADRLQLSQLIVPTRGGVFRCDIRRDDRQGSLPIAKTWISYTTVSERDLDVVYESAQAATDWRDTAPKSDADRGIDLVETRALPTELIDKVARALERHTWLRMPYTERRDHLSEMWEAARGQSREQAGE